MPITLIFSQVKCRVFISPSILLFNEIPSLEMNTFLAYLLLIIQYKQKVDSTNNIKHKNH